MATAAASEVLLGSREDGDAAAAAAGANEVADGLHQHQGQGAAGPAYIFHRGATRWVEVVDVRHERVRQRILWRGRWALLPSCSLRVRLGLGRHIRLQLDA